MRVSYSWLNDYVDISDLSAEKVADILTDIGHEVEGMEKQSTLPNELIVGEILTAVRHPNADTLQVCTVNTGDGEPLQIVCGAPNARPGIKVAVATVGAVLPGDFKIKKGKIRGEVSNGMLCSEQELGLGEGHDGIIELGAHVQVGHKVARVLGLDDTVYELNVTPNRGDCLGVIGVARDLAARIKKPLRKLEVKSQPDMGLKTEDLVKISIENPDDCGRFVALAVKDVAPIESPKWMQQRLTAVGMRPINLIVDATNYAMMEFSQPVHAYDARFIKGKQIIVKSAKGGETFTTLDENERKLEIGDIMIADGERAIGLAGIMGGLNSEVSSDTDTVIIEVAYFSSIQVRKTARRLGIHTEASHRFERGTDIDNVTNVAYRVADLIIQGAHEAKAAGKQVKIPRVAGTVVDSYPADVNKRVVAMRLSSVKQLLAIPSLTRDLAIQTLDALEFVLLDSTDDRMVFEVPFYRNDVEREIDLVEEIGRILGYDRIPMQLPSMNIQPNPEDSFIDFQEMIRENVSGIGFRETVTFPFVSGTELASLGLAEDHPLYPTLTLANPLNDQYASMQTSLIPGLVRAVVGNRKRGENGARLFECGRGYFDFSRRQIDAQKYPSFRLLSRPSRHIAGKAKADQGRPTERHLVAGIIDHPFSVKSWNLPETGASFYHGKAAILSLFRSFSIAEPEFVRPQADELPFLNPNASAALKIGNRVVGYLGELHPRTTAKFDLSPDEAPVVFELDLETLFESKGRGQKTGFNPSRFPQTSRDLALLVDKKTTHKDFVDAIAKFKAKKHLTGYRLFDLYEGDKLPEGKKSMAYTFFFQSDERTLTDQEVEQETNALLSTFTDSLGATQR
jgi:phenylalanyl-tRNA synthetase beta chain